MDQDILMHSYIVLPRKISFSYLSFVSENITVWFVNELLSTILFNLLQVRGLFILVVWGFF